MNLLEPGHEKMCLMSYANNKGADQPAHPRSLISAFVVHCLDSIISPECIAEISRTYLASVAAQAGLCLAWSETPEDTFCCVVAQLFTRECMNCCCVSVCLGHFGSQLIFSRQYKVERHMFFLIQYQVKVDNIVGVSEDFHKARVFSSALRKQTQAYAIPQTSVVGQVQSMS